MVELTEVEDQTDRPIRVLVADDDALVRSALAMVIGGADGIVLVAEVADGDEVTAAVAAHTPDVVLMDIRMPRMDGLTATELLRGRPHPPEVIVLTTFNADEQVLQALRAGASGFLLKDTPPVDIVAAVRRVAAGDPILSPAVTRQLIASVTTSEEPIREDGGRRVRAREGYAGLSARERDVARALGRGLSNAEIAGELFMSVATVKSYVSRLLTRLGLNSRVQVALLIRDAEIDSDPTG